MKHLSLNDDKQLKAMVRQSHFDTVKRKQDESALNRLNEMTFDRLAHQRAQNSLEVENLIRQGQREQFKQDVSMDLKQKNQQKMLARQQEIMEKEEWKRCFDYQTQKELKSMHDRNIYYDNIHQKMKRNINHFQIGANKQSALQFAEGQQRAYSNLGTAENDLNNNIKIKMHQQTQNDANKSYENHQS